MTEYRGFEFVEDEDDEAAWEDPDFAFYDEDDWGPAEPTTDPILLSMHRMLVDQIVRSNAMFARLTGQQTHDGGKKIIVPILFREPE